MSIILSSESKEEAAQWVYHYGDLLYRIAKHKVQEDYIAKDLVHDTYIAALTNFRSLKNSHHGKSWLIAILHNKIADHFRAKFKMVPLSLTTNSDSEYPFDHNGNWKRGSVPIDWPHEGELSDNPEFRLVLAECLCNIPSGWAACLHLKYFTGKKTNEICQELNINPTNLWQIMHRAKLKLRSCLEKNWFRKEVL